MAQPADAVRADAPFSIWSIRDSIQAKTEELKNSFEDLTHKVFKNPTAARIAQSVVYGAPYCIATVAVMALPAYVALTSMAVFASAHLVRALEHSDSKMIFSASTYKNLFNGIGMAYLWKGLRETAYLALQMRARPMAIVVNLTVAGLAIIAAPKFFKAPQQTAAAGV